MSNSSPPNPVPPREGRPLNAWYVLLMATVLTIIGTLMMAEHSTHPLEGTDEADAPNIFIEHIGELQKETSTQAGVPDRTMQELEKVPEKSQAREILVRPDDYIYKLDADEWDAAPIVIEEYKLLFFSVPKVACTTFKQLFRRMAGYEDWKSQDVSTFMPHNPAINGLKYLYNYSLEQANEFMTSPEWTRAIFVRDPKIRFLSAFLDKGLGNFGIHVKDRCCKATWHCIDAAATSEGFLEIIHNCSDPHWVPQMDRMEAKYWKYINFVGHMEHISEDGPELMHRIGAWDKYGATGWGKNGTKALFKVSANDQSHTKNSKEKIWQWLTPALERKIEKFYEADYRNEYFGYVRGNLTKEFWINPKDKIWSQGSWDGAPIVVKKYKLIFFTIPRVGDIVWKQAFRRMVGLHDWKQVGGPKGLPHDPESNGLTYLYNLNGDDAEQIMKNDTWTKAVFVRNPKDRFLETFAHFSTHDEDVHNQCCRSDRKCAHQAKEMRSFYDLTLACASDQWELQSERMEPKYWEYVNFLGRMETVEEDSKRLLERIGAWDDIGASGWGPSGQDRIFAPTGTENDSIARVAGSYDLEIDQLLNQVFKKDFENQRFAFSKQPTTVKPSRVKR